MSNEPVTPVNRTASPRPSCPFYGFHNFRGMFTDSKGNQCAIKKEGYRPCIMDIAGDAPCWKECIFYDASLLEELGDSAIFPDELMPKGAESWSGIRFKDWAEHILEGKALPIEV
ncbi:MAG: hypothetical protein AABW80_00805 [Nanoarchaeota archaeon]